MFPHLSHALYSKVAGAGELSAGLPHGPQAVGDQDVGSLRAAVAAGRWLEPVAAPVILLNRFALKMRCAERWMSRAVDGDASCFSALFDATFFSLNPQMAAVNRTESSKSLHEGRTEHADGRRQRNPAARRTDTFTTALARCQTQPVGDPMDDLGIISQDALIPPQILQEEYPLPFQAKVTVFNARKEAAKVLKGSDDRLIVIGASPACSSPSGSLLDP